MLTTIVFALTLAMIAAHAGEWVLLGRVARAARTGVPVRSSLTGFLGLMNFLRFEAFYYVALFAFWLFTESNLPGVAVFLLGAVHLGGWAALERKHSLPRLEEVAAQAAQDAGGAGRRLRGGGPGRPPFSAPP